jgi:thiol-disulfide isomerase/thioredoxin
MKKRILNVCFAIYCVAAILVAHSAVAENQISALRSSHTQAHVETLSQTAGDHQRLDGFNTQFNIQTPRARVSIQTRADDQRKHYRVVVWSASWCGPCQQYKNQEIPALLRSGYKVEVLDYDRDNPPASITSVPTVVLYYRGKIVKTKVYWKARDLDQFVEGRMTLKE